MKVSEMKAFFKKYDDEFLKFENIPAERRLSNRPDLHAFLLLDRLVPGEGRDMVSRAAHDQIFLDVEPKKLARVATEQDVADLYRCGVMYDNEHNCLTSFA